MTATDLVEDVREELNTELSRLGSSKSLYADTDGNLEPDAVLAAMADAAHYAAETAEGWTDEDEAADVYAEAAETFREHADAIADELGDHEPTERPAAIAVLQDLEGTAARLGGLVGWTLVSNTKATQASGFFTGQADPGTASLFRGFGDDYEGLRDGLLAALADASDADAASDAAEQVVGAAYEEYVDRLEAQGVNPKPVC